MKALRISLLLIVAIFILGIGGAQAARTEVTIGQIVLEDYTAVDDVERAVRRSLFAQDLSVTSGPTLYRVDVYQQHAEYRRTFNWLILLFPVWPLMGVTTSHIDVRVQSNVSTSTGARVWEGTGDATASTVWFSDFRYPDADRALAQASARSIRGVGSTLSHARPFAEANYASNTLKWGLRVAF